MIDKSNLIFCLKNGKFKKPKALKYIVENGIIIAGLSTDELNLVVDGARKGDSKIDFIKSIFVFHYQFFKDLSFDDCLKFCEKCYEITNEEYFLKYSFLLELENRTIIDKKFCRNFLSKIIKLYMQWNTPTKSIDFSMNIAVPLSIIYNKFFNVISRRQEEIILKFLMFNIKYLHRIELPPKAVHKENDQLLKSTQFILNLN